MSAASVLVQFSGDKLFITRRPAAAAAAGEEHDHHSVIFHQIRNYTKTQTTYPPAGVWHAGGQCADVYRVDGVNRY